MRDVPAWLKTLRLHKYSYLFTNLSYEDMLDLTEEKLAEQGVTKGARHKLALSILKLQQRYHTLLDLEKDLVQPQTNQSASFGQKPLLVGALDELKTILATPLKPSRDGDVHDIPMQFTKVLGKLCSRLALENVDDAVLCSCITILEKVLQHDCFTPSQKEKVQQWRSRLGNPRPTPKWQHNNHAFFNRRYSNSQQHSRKPSLNLGHIGNSKSTNNFMVQPHRNSISTPYLQSSSSQTSNQNNLGLVQAPEKRPSLQENSLEQLQRTLQRTYSAPRDNFLGHSSNALETTDPEINSCLESLCLRMTEQAIGGFGEV
ncbi:protein Smaug homolog 1 [Phymastichus coffea]|uniref:protein Smaug homolog 1 n=1 Tax=Phymastichus coffea TaxID=108790 RepID=UPI00273BD475|nr:protein Smaug homolog 1 [Phymastichus coffea]